MRSAHPAAMLLSALALALALLGGGCAVGPDYRRPEAAGGAPVPAAFANARAPGVGDGAVENAFWTRFADTKLAELVTAALESNYDIAVATAALQAARAGQRLVHLDEFPTVKAGASADRGLESAHQAPGFPRPVRQGNTFDTGFDAAWELDFFGRVRRGVEAATADREAVEASLRDVQVTMVAEIARDYFSLRGLQERLAVAVRNAANQQETLRITEQRLAAGRGNELDTSRAEAQLETTLSGIPVLEADIAATIYGLSVLTGRQPDALTATLVDPRPMPELPLLTEIGSPAELLRRRPDIRVAERHLAATTARIGVAVGDLFPRITFFGSVGYDAGSASAIGSLDSQRYSFGPSVSWAAFDLGRVRARIAIARASADGALAEYQSVVLRALEETEAALVSYGNSQRRRATLERAAAASARAASLADQRFRGGLTDFVNVLEAERDALGAEDALARSRTETATSLVALYKALGGSWQTP